MTQVLSERLSGTWIELPMLYSGQVTALSFDPESPTTLYIATSGGSNRGDRTTVTKYSTLTKAKEVVGGNLATEGISVLMPVPDGNKLRLVAGVWGRGIFLWESDESSWRLNNKGLTSYTISTVIADADNPLTLYASSANYGGVFQSKDGGESWDDISGETLFGLSINDLFFTKADGGNILAGSVDGRVFYLGHAETEWIPVAAFPGEGGITTIAGDPVDGLFIYAGTSIGSIMLSNDGGMTWIWMARLPNAFRINSIAVKPGNPRIVYADAYGVGGHRIWISRDYGATWDLVPNSSFSREFLRLATVSTNPDSLFAYGVAGLFVSTDEGKTWDYESELSAPIAGIGQVAVSPLDGGATYLAVGGSVFSSIGQQRSSWTRGNNLPAVVVRFVAPDTTSANTAYAGVYLPNLWSVFVTSDNGMNWKPTAKPAQIPERYLNDTMSLAVAHNDVEQILYAGTNGCGVIHSVDRGETWETFGRVDCALGENEPKNVLRMAVDPNDLNRLYVVADSSQIYSSRDRGGSWHSSSLDLSATVNDLVADPRVQGRVYLLAGSEGIWRSDDEGYNWRKLTSQFDDQFLIDMTISDEGDALYVVAAANRIWRSTDGGEHWQSINRNLSASNGTNLAYDRRTHELILGTVGDGLYSFVPGSLLR